MSLEAIRREAKSYFEDIAPSHDWYHVERVLKLCMELAEQENADQEILRLATVLHDIGRGKEDRGSIEDHAAWSAREARSILEQHGYEGGMIEDVQHCIRAHRYSNDVAPETLEAKVLSDADNLDALGAIGVARTFAYSGENHRVLVDNGFTETGDEAEREETGVDHLRGKILSLKGRMYTESARQVAEERHQFVKQFLKQIESEVP